MRWLRSSLNKRAAPRALFARALTLLALLPWPCGAVADIAYVTTQNADQVTVLDLEARAEITRFDVPGGPAGVQVAHDLEKVFTVSPNDATLRAFTPQGAPAGVLTLDGGPIGITRAGAQLFVSDWYNARIWVIDAVGLRVTGTLATGAAPAGLAVSPDGRWLVSADRDADSLSVFALPGLTLHRRIAVGTRPFAVTFDAQGRVYAANVGSNDVTVADPGSGAQIATLPTGNRPYGVAFAAGRIFVTNQYSDTISVFDRDFTAMGEIEAGEYPEGIAALHGGTQIAVANWMSNTLMLIDATSLEVLADLPTGDGPRAFGAFILEE